MRFLAASSLFFAAPLMAQVFPETEPNDVVANAQVVALGSQINASLTAGEFDWYTFTTPGGYHSIQMLSDTATGVDFVMDIFDASGTTLLAWCDDSGQSGYTSYSSYFGVIPAGTYTVRCKAFSSTSTGNYQFNLSQPASKPYTGAEVEPNDTLATAQAVGDGAQIDASLAAPVVVNTNAAATATVVATDAVASSTATIITTAGPQVAGTYNGIGFFVRFTSGANLGVRRRISANTATDITVASAFPAAAAPGDTYEVFEYDSDFYRIDVTAPRALVAFSVTDGDDTWVDGYTWEVRDAAGALNLTPGRISQLVNS